MSSMASESEVDMTVLSPPLFNYGAYDLLGEWNRFFQKLKYYLVANGRADSPDEEKIGVLLSHLGNEGKAIYESLEAKDNPGERITSFEELTEALTSYFDSARNVLFERFKFFKMKRRSGQSVVAFARDLTIAASFCGFSEVDNIIRDKLLEQLEDKGLIERILVEGGSLTLARAINICQKWEERKSQANENKPPDNKDDPEPPNSSATIDSRRKLESELETATDYGGGFPAVTILGVVPQERQTTAPVNREGDSADGRGLWDDAGPITHIDEEEYKPIAPIGLGTTIKEEQDACDSSPAAPSPQPHRWLPARDEPSSPHTDANQEIKMEPVEEDEEMTLHSPLVIPTAVSGIETDPLSADDQSKDLNPDGEIKMEPVDEEMAFHSPLVIPTAVSGIETDLLSADDQSKGLDPDGEIRMEPVDKDEEMTLHSPLVVPTAVSEIQTDSAGNQSKGEKPYVCDCCHYRASKLYHLKRHWRIHTGEKPFACDSCDYRAAELGDLKKHLRTHSGEKPYACSSCDYRASQRGHLKLHILTHTGEKPYARDGCDNRASVLGQLKKPLRPQPAEKPYACGICDYRASHPGALKTHLRTHTGEKPYACDSCDYRASELGTLKRHLRKHTGEKPYACEFCDYRASILDHLKRHLRKHTGEKPYACDSCDYRTGDLGNLKRHSRMHTGEEPYACDSCEYRASDLSNLRAHLRRLHTDEKNPSVIAMTSAPVNSVL